MGANTLTLGLGTGSLGSLSHTAPARIAGKFERWVNIGNRTNLELPIGTLSDLAEATLTFNNLTAGSIIAEFIEADPEGDGLPINDDGTDIFNTFFEGYWSLTTNNGLLSNDYDVTLEAGGFTSFDVSTSRVLTRSNSSNPWTDDGTHVAAVGTLAGRDNVTILSAELALGDDTNCQSPETDGVMGDASVCINEGLVGYTAVNGDATSTYTWTVVGGAIDGGVSSGVGLTSINVNWGASGGAGSVSVVENNSASFGCGAGPPITLDITINPVPTAAIIGNTTAATNQAGLIYTVTSNAGYTYDWDIVGGAITAPLDPDNDVTGSITVTWGGTPGTGQISVTATESTACSPAQAAATVNLDVTVLDVIESNGIGGGNWTAGSTWLGGIVPTAGNNVRIVSGDNVTLNQDRTINNIEIQSAATLTQNNNRELTINGDFTNNGTFQSNETGGGGVDNVIEMNGSNGVLDGTGTFNMNTHGTLEFTNTTTIASGANLQFIGTREDQVSIDDDIVVTNNGIISISQDLTGDNPNSTWINAAGSTLSVGDQLLNRGILIANSAGNTVNYNGVDDNDNIKEPNGGEYFNLQITGGQIKNMISDLTVLGDLTVSSTLNGSTFTMNVEGDWTNTGIFTEATSTIIFSGSGDQTITGIGGEVFNNLQVTKNSGTLLLDSDVDVSNALTMNEGNIDTQSNQFTLGTSAITEGTLTHVSGTIIGEFDRWVNSASSFLFPVGTPTDFLPATLSFDVLSSGGRIRAGFTTLAPGNLGLPFDDSGFMIRNTFTEGYWTISSPTAVTFTTYDLDLTGNGFVSFTVDSDTRIVSRNNSSSDWVGNGVHVAATGVTAQRDNINLLPLDFAFGDDTNCTPPSTSAITRAVAGENCAGQSGVVYQVTNTPGSTYTWAVAGGTITNGQGENAITITWGATGGTYTLSVTEDNSGASGCGVGTPVTLDVEVNPLPTSAIGGSTSVAAGTTGVVYSVTSRTGYTYDWTIDDEINNTLIEDGSNVATIDWGTVTGDFTVTAIATNTSCGLSADPVTLIVSVFDVIESNGSGGGLWTSGATWDGGVVPQATNSVRIVGNDNVTLNQDRTIDNIIITTNATLTQNNNRELIINGNFTNDGTFDSNETGGGGNDVIQMNGTDGILDGAGTFDMGTHGTLEFRNTTSIASTANLQFIGTRENQVSIDDDIVVTNNGIVIVGQDLTGDNPNATWVNAAGSTLIIGDELLGQGILDASQIGNTVEYNEIGNSNIKTPLNSEYYHLVVSGTNNKTMRSDLSILGDLTISSTLETANHDLTLGGNWVNTGSFTEGSSTITFNGATDQSITNATGETFANLTVNKSGGNLILVNDVDATGSLNLILGTIETETNGTTLTLGTSAPASGTLNRTSGYVIGNFRRWIPSASTGIQFLFPVGTASNYRPMELTFDAISSGGSVIGSFDNTAPGNGTTLPITDGGQIVSNAFSEGFWTAQASNGFATTQYDADITGNGFTSFSFDLGGATRLLVRSNGSSDWIDPIPGTHVNGTGNEVERDNITTSLDVDLAIGDITNCPTINTSNITGEIEVCFNNLDESYSVINTPGSTYSWTVIGGTIDGGTGAGTQADPSILNAATNSITVDWAATGSEATVQVVENNGCATGTPVMLNVNVNPIPAGSISGNLGVAEGANGEVYSIVNRTGYSYQWSTSDGTIVGPNTNSSVTINWSGTGTGTLTLTVSYDNAAAFCGAVTPDEVINETITFFSEFESVATGNFSDPSTWLCNCVPPPNSNIIVTSPDVVTLDAAISVRNLTVDNGATFDNSTFLLTINGDYTLNGDHIGTAKCLVRGSLIDGNGTYNAGLFDVLSNNTIAPTADLRFDVDVRARSTILLSNNGRITFNGSLLGLNATSGLVNNAGAFVSFNGTDVLPIGRIIANSLNNDIIYSASGNQNIKSPSGAPAEYYNLQILGSGNKNLNSDLGIANDLTINGGTLLSNANAIRIEGDWNNQSDTFNEGTGTVEFNGSGTQTITNINGAETFYNLGIDNSSGGQGVVPAGGNTVNVSNQLILTNGFMSPTATEPLILGSAASISGGSTSSYVKGPLVHTLAATGPSTKNFPVGDGGGFKRAEIVITQDAATSTQYTVEYITGDANALAVSTSQPLPDAVEDIQNVSSVGYWDILKGAGANLTAADLTLFYTAADFVSDFNNLIIAKADDETSSSSWVSVGEGGTGNIAGSITTTTPLTSFSIVALGNNMSGSNPLPITLLSFTGETIDGRNHLQWITASEVNNDYFELQRSFDGINYETIKKVEGQGTTNRETIYDYVDKSPFNGLNYYRLKQVDFDGTVTILHAFIVVLKIELEHLSLSFTTYPNPTTPNNVNLEIVADQRSPLLIRMLDLYGRVMYVRQFEPGEMSGSIKIKSNEHMKQGIYLIVVEQEGRQVNRKLMIKE